jgi:hypothetical protein
MTPAERVAFQQGFLTAFAVCVGVQRAAFNHLDGCLGDLERSVGKLDDRSRRLRVVRRPRFVPAFRGWSGEQFYRLARY